MNTRSNRELLGLTLLFGLGAACVVPEKQIGQLDEAGDLAEDDSSTDAGTDTSSETSELVEDPECTQAIDALGQLFTAQVGQACALVIRSVYTTGELLGWSLECDDDDTSYTLDDARNLSTWGGQDLSEEPSIYILYAEPDVFGGLAVVGKRSGLLFDGDIAQQGQQGVGGVNLPVDLEDPSSLGSGCFASQPPIFVEYWPYDVTNLEDLHGLNPEVDLTFGALWETAVFYADLKGPVSVSMLVFPRTVGNFDPNTAEIITVIQPQPG